MEDITPGLIDAIAEEFQQLYNEDKLIQGLLEKIKDGTATYREAYRYSFRVSQLIGAAYENHVSSASLPDGRMYYNIASRLIPETMDSNHSLVTDFVRKVQEELNRAAGLGLKAQEVPADKDRINGLVELASDAETYDDIEGTLLAAFENYNLHIVDESIHRNAEFQYKAGLRPTITRKAERKCCKWCHSLAGEYSYPDVHEDVYRRHENCRCLVEYDPADSRGRKQNVHSKSWN